MSLNLYISTKAESSLRSMLEMRSFQITLKCFLQIYMMTRNCSWFNLIHFCDDKISSCCSKL